LDGFRGEDKGGWMGQMGSGREDAVDGVEQINGGWMGGRWTGGCGVGG
jgi:hypothetical protein